MQARAQNDGSPRIGVLLAMLLVLDVPAIGMVHAEPRAPAAVEQGTAVDIHKLIREARTLTPEQSEQLEKKLVQNPFDQAARASLLGYYFSTARQALGVPATLQARRKHIYWLIENQPGSKLAGTSAATIDPTGHQLADKTGYEKARQLWQKQVAAENTDQAVLLNAANFLRLHDKEMAEALLKRAGNPYFLGELYAMGVMRVNGMNQNGLVSSSGSSPKDYAFARHARRILSETSERAVLDAAASFLLTRGVMMQVVMMMKNEPLDPPPVEFAGELLQRCPDCSSLSMYYRTKGMMSTSAEERRALAKQELALLEKRKLCREVQPDDPNCNEHDISNLIDLAEVAFKAEEMDKASGYAQRILAMIAGHKLEGMYGQGSHKAHTVLGRIDLRMGDIDAAGRHLLESGNVKSGVTLSSFGPSMALAKELLENGKKDVVLVYLGQCKKFWPYGKTKLSEWITDIRRGDTPGFGPNLNY